MKGRIKWYDSTKGFGFINTEEGNELFVHYTGINSKKYEIFETGEEVEFQIAESKRGPHAINVIRVEE